MVEPQRVSSVPVVKPVAAGRNQYSKVVASVFSICDGKEEEIEGEQEVRWGRHILGLGWGVDVDVDEPLKGERVEGKNDPYKLTFGVGRDWSVSSSTPRSVRWDLGCIRRSVSGVSRAPVLLFITTNLCVLSYLLGIVWPHHPFISPLISPPSRHPPQTKTKPATHRPQHLAPPPPPSPPPPPPLSDVLITHLPHRVLRQARYRSCSPRSLRLWHTLLLVPVHPA